MRLVAKINGYSPTSSAGITSKPLWMRNCACTWMR